MTEIQTAAAAIYRTRSGSRFPPGATSSPDGVNFCIFSRHATHVELLLYAEADSSEPFQVITLTPQHNRTFFFWHVFVEGLPPRTCYTWRANGPTDTAETGRYFNPRKELLDPWARAVTDTLWDRRRGADPEDTGHASLRGVVTESTRPRDPTASRAWAEWNGRYRDVMRRFLRGDPELVGEVATRIAGSPDLYADGRLPGNSINFITCHDGFTLHDLTSYNAKRNQANGEDNRDGGPNDARGAPQQAHRAAPRVG